MCTHGPDHSTAMSRRLHLTLTDAQYAYLNTASERTSLSVAELVRRALDEKYPASHTQPREADELTVAVWRHSEPGVGRRRGLRLDPS